MPKRRLELDIDEVDILRSQDISWAEIARKYNTNRTTIYEWRKRNNFEDTESKVQFDHDVVVEEVKRYLSENPMCGERFVLGFVRGALNMKCTRDDIRSIIKEVDPDGLQLRKQLFGKVIKRRVYDIKDAHIMWHIGMYVCISR